MWRGEYRGSEGMEVLKGRMEGEGVGWKGGLIHRQEIPAFLDEVVKGVKG